MKLSVSLPRDDVEFLNDYANAKGMASRSAVVHRAVRLLRSTELGPAYEDAWSQWEASDESDLWDGVTGDGLG